MFVAFFYPNVTAVTMPPSRIIIHRATAATIPRLALETLALLCRRHKLVINIPPPSNGLRKNDPLHLPTFSVMKGTPLGPATPPLVAAATDLIMTS
jgi:hypothetical protein